MESHIVSVNCKISDNEYYINNNNKIKIFQEDGRLSKNFKKLLPSLIPKSYKIKDGKFYPSDSILINAGSESGFIIFKTIYPSVTSQPSNVILLDYYKINTVEYIITNYKQNLEQHLKFYELNHDGKTMSLAVDTNNLPLDILIKNTQNMQSGSFTIKNRSVLFAYFDHNANITLKISEKCKARATDNVANSNTYIPLNIKDDITIQKILDVKNCPLNIRNNLSVFINNIKEVDEGIGLYPPQYFYPLGHDPADNSFGRDNNGTLFQNGVEIVGEGGFYTNDDSENSISKHLLTMPLRKTLDGNSWSDAISGYKELDLSKYSQNDLNSRIIIIESPAKVRLKNSLQIKGIVVRKGGMLLIDDANDVTIKTQFIIVESGGLFQAGSNVFNKFRYSSKLTILLTNDTEISTGIMTCSQYGESVYYPGGPAKGQTSKNLRAPYTGMSMMANMYGGKSISVGFNGNLFLCGMIPKSVRYKGTWNATGAINVNENNLMTYFEDPIEAVIQNVETEYSNTWCQLLPNVENEGIYKSGTSVIYLKEDVSDWQPGSKIVLTCRTDNYTNLVGVTPDNVPIGDLNGDIPIWLDHDDQQQRDANQNANQKLFETMINPEHNYNYHNYGVEVATILSAEGNMITLENPLKFDHKSVRTELVRTIEGKKEVSYVETYTHVGLLTRNIVIMPEFNSSNGGKGCNNWYKTNPNMHMVTRCNYENETKCTTLNCKEVYKYCYASRNLEPNDEKFCGKDVPKQAVGHWIFGTENKVGCNAIAGGQTIFRYGSSVRMDGVELKYMGIPANFGTIAQYSIHFHLAGFIKSFKGYLPEKGKREGTIINCSNWCSFSRWVTVHGTHEADIKNNIGFISYGSGYFVEDGIEINNTFEHNMAICTLPARYHPYYNPIPIYPNVSSDVSFASSFWFKNNQNRCFRNVCCNSPQPVIGIWAVPQHIGKLRGPSTISLGDSKLGLPGLIGQANAYGIPDMGFLSQNLNGNRNGTILKFPTKDKYNNSTACWMPEYMKQKLLAGSDLCTAYSVENSSVPYLLYAENIIYQMAGGLSEFPEALAAPPTDYEGFGGFEGSGYRQILPGHPQFMPSNGQNACTDSSSVAQTTYFETVWGGVLPTMPDELKQYPYQPISESELQILDGQGATTNLRTKSSNIPKIFSNFLTFNLGPSSGLWGGAGWTKLTPSWLISCCFLQEGGGNCMGAVKTRDNPNSNGVSVFDVATSALWSTTCGDGINQYPNIYHVMYDMITDGSLGLPPNPNIMGGKNMFITDKASPYPVENILPNNNLIVSVSNNFFVNNHWKNIPPLFWSKNKLNLPGNIPPHYVYYGLYTFDDNKCAIQKGNEQPKDFTTFTRGKTRKYPYLSAGTSLFTSDDEFTKNNPQWKNIVVNSQVGHFINGYGIELGNKLCEYLYYIPVCSMSPWQLSGDPLPSGYSFATSAPAICQFYQ